MNTRDKILEAAPSGPAILVVGTFDPLLAAHSERLQQLAKSGVKLAVAVADLPNALLPLQARREMVAALRVVDFVVPFDSVTVYAWITVYDDIELHDRWAIEFNEHVRRRNQ